MKVLLEYLVKSIVDEPNQVQVEEEKGEGFVNLKLSVAKEDMGKVIGKKGKIIKAIRTLLKVPAVKQNLRINLDLEEAAPAKETTTAKK